MPLSDEYITLVQRLSFSIPIPGVAIPAGTLGGLSANVPFNLAGQQAFKVISADSDVFEEGASGKLVVEAFAVSILSPTNLNFFEMPSQVTLGLPLGNTQGVALHGGESPLFFWNDFLSSGGLAGQLQFTINADVLNTDVADRTIGGIFTALVQIYQVKTSLAHVGFNANA